MADRNPTVYLVVDEAASAVFLVGSRIPYGAKHMCSAFITSAKEVMFLLDFVCLFVCLIVCLLAR